MCSLVYMETSRENHHVAEKPSSSFCACPPLFFGENTRGIEKKTLGIRLSQRVCCVSHTGCLVYIGNTASDGILPTVHEGDNATHTSSTHTDGPSRATKFFLCCWAPRRQRNPTYHKQNIRKTFHSYILIGNALKENENYLT